MIYSVVLKVIIYREESLISTIQASLIIQYCFMDQ